MFDMMCLRLSTMRKVDKNIFDKQDVKSKPKFIEFMSTIYKKVFFKKMMTKEIRSKIFRNWLTSTNIRN